MRFTWLSTPIRCAVCLFRKISCAMRQICMDGKWQMAHGICYLSYQKESNQTESHCVWVSAICLRRAHSFCMNPWMAGCRRCVQHTLMLKIQLQFDTRRYKRPAIHRHRSKANQSNRMRRAWHFVETFPTSIEFSFSPLSMGSASIFPSNSLFVVVVAFLCTHTHHTVRHGVADVGGDVWRSFVLRLSISMHTQWRTLTRSPK